MRNQDIIFNALGKGMECCCLAITWWAVKERGTPGPQRPHERAQDVWRKDELPERLQEGGRRWERT